MFSTNNYIAGSLLSMNHQELSPTSHGLPPLSELAHEVALLLMVKSCDNLLAGPSLVPVDYSYNFLSQPAHPKKLRQSG